MFVETKFHEATVPDRPYFRQEGLRRVIRSGLDEFYKTIVEPSVVDSLPGGQRKRRKTSVGGRRTRASAHDEEAELPRRAEAQDLAPEDTIIAESSPVPTGRNLQSQSGQNDPLTRLSATSHDEVDLHTEELDLQDNIDSTLDEEDAITLPSFIHDEVSTIDQIEVSRRLSKCSAAAAQATKDVRERLHDCHGFASEMNPAVQWLIDISAERLDTKERAEKVGRELGIIEGEICKIETMVSNKVPLGTKLSEAIVTAQLDLDEFEILYDEALAQQKATELLTDKFSSAGLHFLTAHTQIDDKAAMAEQSSKDKRLKELQELDSSLATKLEEQAERQEEIQQFEIVIEQAEKEMECTRALFNLVQDPLAIDALAILKTGMSR